MGKRIINVELSMLPWRVLNLGYVGENEHTQIVIDCTEVLLDYPQATCSMVVKPPRGDLYPVMPTKSGNTFIWEITASDVVYAGSGQIQLTFYNGEEIIRSDIGSTKVAASLETTGDAPEPLQNWMDAAEQTAAQIAEDAAEGVVDDLADAKDEAIAAIEAKGEEVIEEIPADYSELSDDVDDLKSALTTKADKVGSSPDLIAGTAEQLMSSDVVEDAVPYLYRKSGGGLDIGNRETLEKVVGGTVALNQFVPDEAIQNTSKGVTYTRAKKAPYVLSGTATDGNATFSLMPTSCSAQVGHKYLFYGGIDTSIYLSLSTVSIWGAANPNDQGQGKIANAVSEGEFNLVLLVMNGTAADGKKVIPQLFDLTQMFGPTIADTIYAMEQATAGAGVAWFRKLFPASYYAYNAGELISVNALSRRTVGFNQWDEEWEAGSISSSGQDESGSGRIRSKNYIPVISGETYFYKGVAGQWFHICYYNAQKQFVGDVNPYFGNNVTIPSGVAYCRFNTNGNYGTTYNHDICINLSDSSRNGEYVPYEKHSYPLDSSLTLRGIPKLDSENKLYYDGDEYAPDGKVNRRFSVVDLGELTWSYDSKKDRWLSTAIAGIKPCGGSVLANLIASDFVTYTNNYLYNNVSVKGIAVNNNLLVVRNGSSATSPTGTTIYELATPTTEAAEPYAEIQNVDPYGTEEFVSTSIVPVGHSTKYPANLVKKLEGLPWNFATLIAPTETTTTATRAYTVGSYLILNNTLYKVTSAIANGGTITPGTNVTATTIMAELTALV